MTRKWWTLGVVSVATFMLLLDITVVNTALPAIQEDLGASFTELQWVVDAYTLTLAAFVLTAGSLADRLGRRRIFAAGLAIFSISSLAAGLAGDPTTLNVARAVQGVGGGAMFAVSLALIAQEFPAGRERGQAMGIYGATIGAAVAVGPLVGGALVDAIGWESIFYLNVPIGLAALFITYAKVTESRDPAATRIDWWGQLAFSASLFMLVLALLRGNEEGWGSGGILALFGGAALTMAAFFVIESRVREPMLPLGLFRGRSFTGVQIAAFAISSAMFAMFLYLTLYMQNYLELTPFEAGLRYLPITVTSFFAAAFTGAVLSSKFSPRALLTSGLLLVAAGLFLMSGIDATDEWTTLLAGLLAAGVGIGMLNPVIADVAVSVVPNEQSGMASGINDTFRQVGVAVGIAAWGALFIGRGESEVTSALAGTPGAEGDRPRELVEAASTGNLDLALAQVPPEFRDQVSAAAQDAFLSGLNEILVIAAVVAVAGAALSGALVRIRAVEQGVGEVPAGEAPETEPASA